jgi:hypothetical protein
MTLRYDYCFRPAWNFTKLLIILNRIKLAEGVVSEPILSSGDQVHKGGFATQPSQPFIAGKTCLLSAQIQSYTRSIGNPAGRQFRHAKKLGTWPHKTKSPVLESHSADNVSF